MRLADHSSRGVLPTVVCIHVCVYIYIYIYARARACVCVCVSPVNVIAKPRKGRP